ncbi:MAG: hypothetical protein MMC33_010236 [Icmadophila ericetorum]|nr:hypothetical protein [Icmadophila ericetorum]
MLGLLEFREQELRHMVHVQINIAIRQNLLVHIPLRLVQPNHFLRDGEQQGQPRISPIDISVLGRKNYTQYYSMRSSVVPSPAFSKQTTDGLRIRGRSAPSRGPTWHLAAPAGPARPRSGRPPPTPVPGQSPVAEVGLQRIRLPLGFERAHLLSQGSGGVEAARGELPWLAQHTVGAIEVPTVRLSEDLVHNLQH